MAFLFSTPSVPKMCHCHAAFMSDEAMARLLAGGIEQMKVGMKNVD